MVQQRAGDGQEHAQLRPPEHAAPRGRRRAQPLQRKNEERRGDQVSDLDDVFRAIKLFMAFSAPLDLNILSMRSVMMKPPTMLLVAATIAIVPSTRREACSCVRRPG